MSNWNISLKYLSAFHFLAKMNETFCGVRVDAKAAGNNFWDSRKRLETERMWILGHF